MEEKSDMVAPTCNSTTEEVEAEDQEHKAIFNYI